MSCQNDWRARLNETRVTRGRPLTWWLRAIARDAKVRDQHSTIPLCEPGL